MSFDIDALDPLYAPSTGTKVSNGLTLREGRQICKVLGKQMVSMDLVEVNPLLGTKEDAKLTAQSANLLIQSAVGHTYL